MPQNEIQDQMVIQGLDPIEEPLEEPKNQEDLKPEKPKGDPKIRFILSQLLVCLLGVLTVLTVKYSDREIYDAVKQKYVGLFCKSVSPSQMVGFFKNFFQKSEQQPDSTGNAQIGEPTSGSKTEKSENLLPDLNPAAENSTAISAQPTAVYLSQKKGLTNEVLNSMAMPVKGTVSSEYGYRAHPIYETRLFHRGIDIAADNQSKISSVLDGTVLEAAYDDSYGNYVFIQHSDSLKTLYAHCSELLVQEGEKVKRGQTIALVGSTGDSTGPHLHFEVRYNDVLINPRWLLKLD